ncbi:uncharacterized protein MONBRDRAFT_26272 [Monosiga brevicollis MX1]|uniref:Pecanex C-terminal domain-containing protein n=1 Tax=Monosiga brevicollis TaxID=81824 RepID=A9V1W0_MONBE|nr:uncharacterized protein MONBRDRAFT_26272 [Monosiga brevicollis MX1]EDQ88631.1 predicted protein [Monosiga brevicollis MX1]|eukprot:XP_001746735.1 hypothetical protein [Monosiga brevicollis MX1]
MATSSPQTQEPGLPDATESLDGDLTTWEADSASRMPVQALDAAREAAEDITPVPTEEDAPELAATLPPSAQAVEATAPEASPSVEAPAQPKATNHPRLFGRPIGPASLSRATLEQVIDKYTSRRMIVIIPMLVLAVVYLSLELGRLYHDLGRTVLFGVAASAMYSLLRSVQPDASASSVGQRSTAFSRPLYFIALSSTALILDAHAGGQLSDRDFYGIAVHDPQLIGLVRDFVLVCILASPAMFLFGVLPIWSTALHHLCEQLELHVFGGTGTINLAAAASRVLLSSVAVGVSWASFYGAAVMADADSTMTRQAVFALACGVAVGTSFWLGRLQSDGLLLFFERAASRGKTRSPSNANSTMSETIEPGSTLLAATTTTNTTALDSTSEGAPFDVPRSVDPHVEPDADRAPGVAESNTPSFMSTFENSQRRLFQRRAAWDALCATAQLLIWLLIVLTGLFAAAQPHLRHSATAVCCGVSFLLYYVLHQLRAAFPFGFRKQPLLTNREAGTILNPKRPVASWVEQLEFWLNRSLLHVLLPLAILAFINDSAEVLVDRWGTPVGSLLLALGGHKALRLRSGDLSLVYVAMAAVELASAYDVSLSETPVVDLFVVHFLLAKGYEWLLKLRFLLTYNGVYHMHDVLGSGLHAFTWPLALPHLIVMVVQSGIAALVSAPLYPVMGSAIFLVSYFRPIRFWEKDYRTSALEQATLRYDSRGRMLDVPANELNGIFYQHVLLKLRLQLARDIQEGRWGVVSAGDVFLMCDLDNRMTIFVHIIERGDGFVAFQIRGLEFAGTYCQSRELEALDRDPNDDRDLCQRCRPCTRLPWLSCRAILRQQTYAWEAVSPMYVLKGYSISLNPASSMFGSYELCRVLFDMLSRAIVYYMATDAELTCRLLASPEVQAVLKEYHPDFVNWDPLFVIQYHEDYDARKRGMSLQRFYEHYGDWLKHCLEQARTDAADDVSVLDSAESAATLTIEHDTVRLCFALSLLARRTMLRKMQQLRAQSDAFLHGYHALFSGLLKPSGVQDRWLELAVPEAVPRLVYRSARMALRLHQDHFLDPAEYEDMTTLFESIQDYDDRKSMMRTVICNEADRSWRHSVMSDFPSLLSLRYNLDDSSYNREFFIVSLTGRYRSYKLFKVNRECVRGLWAAQQQEVLFLRNPALERGSIQNCICVLRNMISQSNDQPVGYPIFVSPIVTSYTQKPDLPDPVAWFVQTARWLQQRFAAMFAFGSGGGDLGGPSIGSRASDHRPARPHQSSVQETATTMGPEQTTSHNGPHHEGRTSEADSEVLFQEAASDQETEIETVIDVAMTEQLQSSTMTHLDIDMVDDAVDV